MANKLFAYGFGEYTNDFQIGINFTLLTTGIAVMQDVLFVR